MASIYQNVKKDLDKYDNPIILLHDSNTMKNTAAVLPEILEMIREKGYRFDTLASREGTYFQKAGDKNSITKGLKRIKKIK